MLRCKLRCCAADSGVVLLRFGEFAGSFLDRQFQFCQLCIPCQQRETVCLQELLLLLEFVVVLRGLLLITLVASLNPFSSDRDLLSNGLGLPLELVEAGQLLGVGVVRADEAVDSQGPDTTPGLRRFL